MSNKRYQQIAYTPSNDQFFADSCLPLGMREVKITLNDRDYLDFQSICNESGLLPDEKMEEIVRYYLIIERNRKKQSSKIVLGYGS